MEAVSSTDPLKAERDVEKAVQTPLIAAVRAPHGTSTKSRWDPAPEHPRGGGAGDGRAEAGAKAFTCPWSMKRWLGSVSRMSYAPAGYPCATRDDPALLHEAEKLP